MVGSSNALVLGSRNGTNGATSDVSVGIGTTTPNVPLDVESEEQTNATLRVTSFGSPSIVTLRNAGGTRGAAEATAINDVLFELRGEGHVGTGFTAGGRATILARATQDWTVGATGSAIDFFTTPNGTATPLQRVVITHDGRVGIGRSAVHVSRAGCVRIPASSRSHGVTARRRPRSLWRG